MKRNSGIYAIVNMVSGNRYIGRAVDLDKRKYTHFWQLRNNRHCNRPLQAAFNKGEPLVFTVIEQCKESKLNEREVYWINHYNTLNDGYNLCEGGQTTTGYHFTEEQRKKMSETRKGVKRDEDVVRRSIETRKKRLESDTAFREKMQEVWRESGRRLNRSRVGIKLSDEHREKIRQKMVGRPISDWHKEKLREMYSGEGSTNNKLKREHAIDIRIRRLKGESGISILADYPFITTATICDIYRGRRWRCLPMDIESLEQLKREVTKNGTEVHTIQSN